MGCFLHEEEGFEGLAGGERRKVKGF